MSKRHWNSAGDRRLLRSLGLIMCLTLLRAKKTKQYQQHVLDVDSDSDDDLLPTSILSFNPAIPLVFTIGTLA